MIITLSNGKEIILADVIKDPKAEAIAWLRERKEKEMQPTIEILDCTGVKAVFADGAEVILTTQGRFPCSLCGDGHCRHFHAALPHWDRFRWDMAEREDSPWGPSLLQGIGIVPPYIVRPDLVTSLSRWAPFGRGEEIVPGVRMWYTIRGRLYRFDGGQGHVYVGSDHPDGHTACLICRDRCDHVARALELEAQL